MHNINRDLCGLMCRACDNLDYYDGYRCKLNRHSNKDGTLSMVCLKNCEFYKLRKGKTFPECDNFQCGFWCDDCYIYNELHNKTIE